MQHNKKLEEVSELVHQLWMGWAKEMLDKEHLISEERRNRWQNDCFKPYSELSEEMKDLDRKFAKMFLNLINQ